MSLRPARRLPPPGHWPPPRIMEIRPSSPCHGKVHPGDRLVAIDGMRPLDILDCLQASEARRVTLELRRGEKSVTHRIRKTSGTPLGLVFDEAVFDGVRRCRNRCVFCFVDQLPEGLRPSLYIKDDDYRLSFYYGNFVTLNNLSRDDLERIKRLRLSPLYVSLHSTDPELRGLLMGGDAGAGLAALEELAAEGLELHLQVVVCPGINDGEELRRTLREALEGYAPASLGVVPVGLTRHVGRLPQRLKGHDRGTAREVLAAVREYQALAQERHGRRTFFAADEFYLLAGEGFPPAGDYDDYPQLENGIGMARKFMEEMKEGALACVGHIGSRRGIVTGAAGGRVLNAALDLAGLRGVEVVEVENRLLGESVTVSALLGGADIAAALREAGPASRELLIPDSMLKEGMFIDDMTPAEVERATGYRLLPVAVEGGALLHALLAEEGTD
ncbi:MAG: DUF512 domain-containing protein [Actinomycetota bacterium]